MGQKRSGSSVACGPGVRVILSSGYNEQDVTQRFVGKGLAGFIQKPYQLSTLVAVLKDVLEKGRD